jgi:glucosamine--fructose-6-phosphate aminotransferase (isomerizing)
MNLVGFDVYTLFEMNLADKKYSKYALCKEMVETVEIIKNFDQAVTMKYISKIESKGGLFLIGEGSSRIFPAKHIIYQNHKKSCGYEICTEGSLQAMEYDLDNYAVFGSSNSGKTKELIQLFSILKEKKQNTLFAVVANEDTTLQYLAKDSTLLTCGQEEAVAATKSVVEQALFFESIYANLLKKEMVGLDEMAEQFSKTLKTEIDPEIVHIMTNASIIYFAGRNNGVAEEIALKTNEITRKKSGYLEGTYAVHGIEEVLIKKDVLVVFDPFEGEEEKFYKTLVEGAGIEVIAISIRPTVFKTILIPESKLYQNYMELAMGWNLLIETGNQLGIDLDNTIRARKVGNEYF